MQTCGKHLHRSDAENITTRPSGEIPTSSEDESKHGKGLILQSRPEQMKNECSDTLRGIKEEKTEVSIKQEPTEAATEGFLNVACDIEVKAEVERVGAESESRVHLVETTDHRARPGKYFHAVKSAEEMCSDESIEEKNQMEQHFNLKQEPSSEDLLTLPCIKNEKNNADQAAGTGPSHTLSDTGV